MAKKTLRDRLLQVGHSAVVENTSMFDDSEVLKVGKGIPTEVMALNVALSGHVDGGIIPGMHVIAGPSKHFKSLYGLILCKAYLDSDPEAMVLFYDNEFGASQEYLDSVGVDRNRVIHAPFGDIEELKSDLVQKLNPKDGITRDDKVMIFVDSLGNAASRKEIEDAVKEDVKADMTRAKAFKSLGRSVTARLRMLEIPFIGINHTYETLEMYARKVVGGGTGIMYSANEVWIIGKAQDKDGKDLKGFKFTVEIEKSRRVKERSKIPVFVKFDGGLSPVSGMFDIAMDTGHIVSPSSGWYQRTMHDVATGEVIEDEKHRRKDVEFDTGFFAKLIANSDFAEAVRAKFQLETGKLIAAMKEDLVEDMDEE